MEPLDATVIANIGQLITVYDSCVNAYVCIWSGVRVCVWSVVCMYVSMERCVCVCVCVCIWSGVHMCVHMYTCGVCVNWLVNSFLILCCSLVVSPADPLI